MKKILVTGDFELPNIDCDLGYELVHLKTPKSEIDVLNHLKDCCGYILGGPEFLSSEMISQLPKLKCLAVMGTGTNSFVDIKAAKKYGLVVKNTPAMNADAVAEFTLAQIINSLSHVFYSVNELKNGTSWYQGQRKSLKDAKIGIIGMGNIGQKVLSLLKLLGSENVSYWSRSKKNVVCEYKSLNDILNQSDLVTIHLQYNSDTNSLLSSRNLKNKKLKILNMSNPRIISPMCLKSFLSSNPQASLFMDGYYNEWVLNQGVHNDEYSLLAIPTNNFTASSHIAAQENKTVQDIFLEAFNQLRQEV